jgi:hypothetical protein
LLPNCSAVWIPWQVGSPFPTDRVSSFDAVVVWNPKAQFPSLSVGAASKRILELMCGGGALYALEGLRSMAGVRAPTAAPISRCLDTEGEKTAEEDDGEAWKNG